MPCDADHIECDLTFLGLVAMMDPPRPEVESAVATCHTAGIRIIMVTGDYGLTAESIARRIGIIREAQPRIVTGADLDSMDEAALRDALMGEVIRGRYSLVEKIAADSSVVGRTIADLDLPEECVIAAIIRRGHLILPHGDTMLQTGDDVLALTSTERLQRLAEILGKSA